MEWEHIKKHVADLCQVEVEAAFAAHLAVQGAVLDKLRQKGLIDHRDVEGILSALEMAAASAHRQSPAVAHHLSLASLQLRNALLAPDTSSN